MTGVCETAKCFNIKRIKNKARLSRPADTREGDEPVLGNFDVDGLQIVLMCTFYLDRLHFACSLRRPNIDAVRTISESGTIEVSPAGRIIGAL